MPTAHKHASRTQRLAMTGRRGSPIVRANFINTRWLEHSLSKMGPARKRNVSSGGDIFFQWLMSRPAAGCSVPAGKNRRTNHYKETCARKQGKRILGHDAQENHTSKPVRRNFANGPHLGNAGYFPRPRKLPAGTQKTKPQDPHSLGGATVVRSAWAVLSWGVQNQQRSRSEDLVRPGLSQTFEGSESSRARRSPVQKSVVCVGG